MRLNYWVVYCGGSVIANPPALTGVEGIQSKVLNLSSNDSSLGKVKIGNGLVT